MTPYEQGYLDTLEKLGGAKLMLRLLRSRKPGAEAALDVAGGKFMRRTRSYGRKQGLKGDKGLQAYLRKGGISGPGLEGEGALRRLVSKK